jgi:hypothetical protein
LNDVNAEATTAAVTRTEFIEASDITTSPVFDHPRTQLIAPAAASALLPLLLAFTSLTSAVTYGSEPLSSARYVSCSALSPFRRRRGQRISLQQAREVALHVLRQANKALHEERQIESRFILRFWDDQTD